MEGGGGSGESSFSGGRGARGGGVPVCDGHKREGGPKGWGSVMSHPFQRERVPRERASTNHSQGEWWGAVLPLQNTVSPQTVLISKSCPRIPHPTTYGPYRAKKVIYLFL